MNEWELTPQELTDLATKYSEPSDSSIGYERNIANAALKRLVNWGCSDCGDPVHSWDGTHFDCPDCFLKMCKGVGLL